MISMGPISTVTVYCCSCSAVSWLTYVVFVGDSSQILPLIFIFFLDCCITNLLLKEFPRLLTLKNLHFCFRFTTFCCIFSCLQVRDIQQAPTVSDQSVNSRATRPVTIIFASPIAFSFVRKLVQKLGNVIKMQ